MPKVLIASRPTDVTDAVLTKLQGSGWDVAIDEAAAVDAIILDSGLVGGGSGTDAVARLIDGSKRWRFGSGGSAGGVIVVVGSRDQLGSAPRVEAAAIAGGLASVVRSLALQLAPAQVRVNLVAPSDPTAEDVQGLLPQPVTTGDVAATVAFLADPRSSYITGQILYVCGGSSLLSSLSV